MTRIQSLKYHIAITWKIKWVNNTQYDVDLLSCCEPLLLHSPRTPILKAHLSVSWAQHSLRKFQKKSAPLAQRLVRSLKSRFERIHEPDWIYLPTDFDFQLGLFLRSSQGERERVCVCERERERKRPVIQHDKTSTGGKTCATWKCHSNVIKAAFGLCEEWELSMPIQESFASVTKRILLSTRST